jgi:hypothetical protein
MTTQQLEPSSHESFIERRRHKRYAMVMNYKLTVDGIGYDGLTGNISFGGAYLSTIQPLITEDSLFQEGEIELNIPENPITVSCYLTYVGTEQNEYPTGVGIAFIEPDENVLATILGEDL